MRWLDALLSPVARRPLGILVAAEIKTWLRARRAWWWLLVLLAFGLQAFAAPKVMAIGLLLAWVLPIELLARIGLQEHMLRTGGLVFTARGIVPRLLLARFLVGLSLLLVLSAPALLRLPPGGVLAVLAVVASLASWGLALGALTRNPRLFELLLLAALYGALQGAAIFDVGAAGAAATAARHAWGLLPAWLLLAWAWPRMARA